MEHYIEDLDAMFKNTQSRLFAHFNAFTERIQRKFDSHIMRNTIEKKFVDMSPVRREEPEPQTPLQELDTQGLSQARSDKKLRENLQETRKTLKLDATE